jgi:predicted nucleotide-binding protein (sugar kinase/HSP70/actin superfamily)
VVAGTPNVVRATLDREGTAFAGRGIAFLDPSLNLLERNLFKRQMFEVWGPSLRVTEDESDFAVEAGFDALARFDLRMQQRGREVLERAEAERRVAVLALGRPYHADPGLNHGVFEELTRLGHPVLTLRSLPRDPQWLARLFRPEAPPGLQAPPLGVSDVWPENFSANSAQKVWAAKLAARHPNLAVLHLSSFKCGHDSPTYAIVDRILNCSGTPVAALQDLDANRPTGSLKLRMRTFAYSLGLYQERLRTAVAADMAGLQARFRPVQWAEPPARPFTREERPRTRVLMGGLTPAHDQFMAAAYAALGYRTESLPPPDAAAFQLGKEYGSRGQCNPAYFTVGNLLRHLRRLCDSEGSTPRQLVEDAMFVTAGSCGPCRFGAYLTEYRKTLRDAGFEGFRVIDFAQQGWLGGSRASANPGIRQDLPFFLAFVRAALAGDVLNLVGYRIRPYETRPGATDRALAQAREWVARAMRERRSVTAALREARALLAAVETERTRPRTRVAVSGEIWAMTTEGDGNYRMHRFLESEGAEVESQPLVRWILYLMWLARHNVDRRLRLKRPDRAQAGLAGTNGRLKKLKLWLSERTVRTWFACYARAAGLEGYRLPVLDEMAAAAGSHYNVDNAGGESFMEVAETILASRHRTVHLIVSVKPFGCMPSSGVSDGIQPAVLARHPGPMFVSVETTGDAAANALSRVQTMLFAARRSAEAEFQEALDRSGFTLETFRSALRSAPGLSETLHHAPRVVAGSAANLVYELAARTPGRRGPPLSGLHPAPPGSRETRPGCAPCPDGTAGDLERAPEGLE